MNTHIFLQTPARLLAETTESDRVCSCCGRRDQDPLPLPSAPPPATRSLAGSFARYLPWLGRECKRLGELPFSLLHALTTRSAAFVAPTRDRRALRRAK